MKKNKVRQFLSKLSISKKLLSFLAESNDELLLLNNKYKELIDIKNQKADLLQEFLNLDKKEENFSNFRKQILYLEKKEEESLNEINIIEENLKLKYKDFEKLKIKGEEDEI